MLTLTNEVSLAPQDRHQHFGLSTRDKRRRRSLRRGLSQFYCSSSRNQMLDGSIKGASSLHMPIASPISGAKTEARASLLSFFHIHATENVTTNYLTNIDYHSRSPNNILTIQYTTTSITIMTLSFPSRREQSFHPSAMPLQHKYVPFPSFFWRIIQPSTNKLRRRKGKREV